MTKKDVDSLIRNLAAALTWRIKFHQVSSPYAEWQFLEDVPIAIKYINNNLKRRAREKK